MPHIVDFEKMNSILYEALLAKKRVTENVNVSFSANIGLYTGIKNDD